MARTVTTSVASTARAATARTSPTLVYGVLIGGVVLTLVLGLCVGAYTVDPGDVLRILAGLVAPVEQTWSNAAEIAVIEVRLPRLLLGMLVGAALAISGAVLQAVFRNPIVNPQIIGVSSGASFGGALAIILGAGSVLLVGAAFAFGMFALLIVLSVGRTRTATPILGLVLAGIVVGAFFSALVSFVTYIADPYSELQSLVFWLLGSLATATLHKVLLAGVPVVAGCLLVIALRWRLNILSLGDDDAKTLGIAPGRLRWLLLTVVGAMVAATVSVSGVIGWVGLVVPHLARLWVGPDHRVLVPVCALLGAVYLALIDTLTRAALPGEIPLGVLTAVIGAPVFLVLLRRNRTRAWSDA